MRIRLKLREAFLFAKGKNFKIEYIAPGFDKISDCYTKTFNEPLKDYYYKLLSFMEDINNKKILDLGCGTGWLGNIILNNFSSYYHGVDISTGMLTEARKLLPKSSSLKLEHNNFIKLLNIIPENTYDIIFLTWSLKYNNPKNLFKKIIKVLKPGGKLALLSETNNSEKEINDALNLLIRKNINEVKIILPNNYLPENAHALTNLLDKTGFSQTIVWNDSQSFRFKSNNELGCWAKDTGFFAGWDQIIEIYQPALFSEFIDHLQSITLNQYNITKKILGAVAIK